MPPKQKTTSGKRTRKSQTGKGIMDIAKKVHKFIKDNKLISRGLRFTPYQTAANAAAMLGYGRKRAKKSTTTGRRVRVAAVKLPTVAAPRRTRRSGVTTRVRVPRATQVGGGIFSDLGGGLGNIANGIGHGLFGGGRGRGRKLLSMQPAIYV